MLGESLYDPYGTEGGGELAGMGLLPERTVFEKQKTRAQVNGAFNRLSGIFSSLSSLPFTGYEIHMGITEKTGVCGCLTTLGGSWSGSVYGCYVHGIFDSAEVSEQLVQSLFSEKGLPGTVKAWDTEEYQQRQYDKLAEGIRQNIDMDAVYRILEDGI